MQGHDEPGAISAKKREKSSHVRRKRFLFVRLVLGNRILPQRHMRERLGFLYQHGFQLSCHESQCTIVTTLIPSAKTQTVTQTDRHQGKEMPLHRNERMLFNP